VFIVSSRPIPSIVPLPSLSPGHHSARCCRLGTIEFARRGDQSTGFKSASAPPRVLAGFARSGGAGLSAQRDAAAAAAARCVLTTSRFKVAIFRCFWAFSECDFGQKNLWGGSRKKGDCGLAAGCLEVPPLIDKCNWLTIDFVCLLYYN
jgi:hypothetical protein